MSKIQLQPDAAVTYLSGPRTAMIVRCDLGRQFLVNLDAREYEDAVVPEYRLSKITEKMRQNAALAPPQESRPATILVETTTRDTGERKEVFGLTARHVVTTRREVPLQSADHDGPRESIAEGWYVDLYRAISCAPPWRFNSVHAYATGIITNRTGSQPSRVENPTFKDIGTPERGFPIALRTTSLSTIRLADGTATEHRDEWTMTVTRLSTDPLDTALFEVPAGFVHTNRVDRVILSEIARAWNQLTGAIIRALQP